MACDVAGDRLCVAPTRIVGTSKKNAAANTNGEAVVKVSNNMSTDAGDGVSPTDHGQKRASSCEGNSYMVRPFSMLLMNIT